MNLLDRFTGLKENEFVIAMIRITIHNIFQGLEALFETILKQLNPNLPFSPTLKPQKIPVETSVYSGSIKRMKKTPNL